MSAIQKYRMLAAVAVLAGLSACSILPQPVVRTAYILPPISEQAKAELAAATAGVKADWRLRVETPQAVAALDSRQWWVLNPDNSIGAYRDVLWAENASVMVRERLVSWMLDSNRFAGVNNGMRDLPADFELSSNLRAFRVERKEGDQGSVYVRLDVDLLYLNSHRIVANRLFEQRAPLDNLKPESIVQAFGVAVDALAQQVLVWTLTEGEQADTSVPVSRQPQFLQSLVLDADGWPQPAPAR